jgi:hypothetical protein
LEHSRLYYADSKDEASSITSEWTKTESSASEVLQPKPGELYLAYYKQSQCWLAALLFPLTDLDSVGISATLEILGISREALTCVTYNIDSREFEWREEYRGGRTQQGGLWQKACGFLMSQCFSHLRYRTTML